MDLITFLYYFLYKFTNYFSAQLPDSLGLDSGDPAISATNSLSSELNLYVRFIFALAIVLFLLILTLWVFRKILRFRSSGIANSAIDVLAIRYIEQRKAIALIRILDRVLIVGIADNAITTLGELSSEETGILNLDKKTDSGIFTQILSRFSNKKTVKT